MKHIRSRRDPEPGLLGCEAAREELSAELDADHDRVHDLPHDPGLEPEHRSVESHSHALARHLETCAACRRHALELRALRRMLAPLTSAGAPPELWDSIAGSVARRRETARRIRRAWRAAACLVGFLATLFFERGLHALLERRVGSQPLARSLSALAHADAPWIEVQRMDQLQRHLITLAQSSSEEQER